MKKGSSAYRGYLRGWMRAYNRDRRPLLPRCNATAKSTGRPCGNPAIKGRSKCRLHGGATGRGKDWHKRAHVKRPKATGFTVEKRLREKLSAIDRDASRRAARRAAMTPEEREHHSNWHLAHKPGATGPRAVQRRRLRQDAEFADLLARSALPISAVETLQHEIDELKRCVELSAHDIFG